MNRGIDTLRKVLDKAEDVADRHECVTIYTDELRMLIDRGDLGGPSPEAERLELLERVVSLYNLSWDALKSIDVTDEAAFSEWRAMCITSHNALRDLAKK